MKNQKCANIRNEKSTKTEYSFREITPKTYRDEINPLAAIIGLLLTGAVLFGIVALIVKLFSIAFTACMTITLSAAAVYLATKFIRARHRIPVINR